MDWQMFFPPDSRVVAMPSWDAPRLFIPSDSITGRWKRSGFYPAYRKSALAYKYVLRCGTAILGRGRVVNRGTATWEVGSFVQEALPTATSISVLLGTEGPARKTTLQVCDATDSVLGYVKYGETEAAIAGIDNEQKVLSSLPDGVAPRLLKYGRVGSGKAIVTSNVEGLAVPATLPFEPDIVAFQTRLQTPVEASPATHPGLAHLNNEISRAWVNDLASSDWPVTIQHGDFAPWNLKLVNGNVRAFDWEYGKLDGFPFLDLAFFSLQTDVKIYRTEPIDAFNRARKILADRTSLSIGHASAIVRLAAYDAHAKGLKDGHDASAFLQQWYKGVWEASV